MKNINKIEYDIIKQIGNGSEEVIYKINMNNKLYALKLINKSRNFEN